MSAVKISNLHDSTLHLLHRAGQRADELFERVVGDHGMTARQLLVLALVHEIEDPSQVAICDRSGIDRSTLADIVRRLVSRGFLARRRSRRDARAYVVRLTEQGRSKLEAALPLVREVDQLIVKALPQSERHGFDLALKRIVHGLSAKTASS